ncbi:hypothetical protein Angca_003067, partial [Angiostrongylus cantonensis]
MSLVTSKESTDQRTSNETEVFAISGIEDRSNKTQPSFNEDHSIGYANEELTTFQILPRLFKMWKNALVLLLTPLIFSPLVFSEKKELRCAFCIGVMVVYWVTEVIPLPATAVIPVVLYPLTGVMTCKAIAQQFMNDANFLFLGGLFVAQAIENWDLHKRIALFVLNMVGGDPKCVMLGIMISTATLSMFISNTATTAMMVPLAQSLVMELISSYNMDPGSQAQHARNFKQMSAGIMVCVCVAANIGGIGMLTGTPINLVLVGQLPEIFGSEVTIDFVTWFIFAFPLMWCCLLAAWLTLSIFFLRNTSTKDARVTELLHKKYIELPKMNYAEKSVAVCLFLLLFLWIFKDPGFITGYGVLFPKKYYTDTTSVMMVAIIIFALPSRKPNFCDLKQKEEIPRLIDWPSTQVRVPWGVVLLLGGGFAVAAGVKESGLSAMIGRSLSTFQDLPLWAFQMLTMAFTLMVTNVCCNLPSATILVPVVATLAVEIQVHPFALMIPVTVMVSCTFVLPVGTPPNAIVFASEMITMSEMASSGILLSIVCLLVTFIYMNSVAFLIFPLSEFPTWADLYNSS